jgi:hypothetical protein
LLSHFRPMPLSADPSARASGKYPPAFLQLGMHVKAGHPAARRKVEVEYKGLTGGFACCLAEDEPLASYGVLEDVSRLKHDRGPAARRQG